MRITKFEHACFVAEIEGSRLVVDPGFYTRDLDGLSGVAAIVVTHEHPDHWTSEQLQRILELNPDARLFGPAGFVAAAGSRFPVTVVSDGDSHTVGPFTLTFAGAKHAVIHRSIPVIDNVGVLINNTVFYPGDSYTVPPVAVDVLAVPSSAPWLKIGEVMDFILDVKPRRTFATHEMVNSATGKAMAGDRIGWATRENGGEYIPLEPGDTFDA